MPDTFTANYNMTKPEVGLSTATWGNKWNVNLDTLDTTLKSISDNANTRALASRTVTGTGLLAGGGDLTANRTLSMGSTSVASRLVGAGSGGTAIGEITPGTGLSFTGNTLNCTVAGGVAASRAINVSGYITGGGDLSVDRTHSLGSMGAAGRLLGAGSGGAGITDIIPGTGLSFSGTTLNVSTPFTGKFTSAQQTITGTGTVINVAHGLGSAPFGCAFELVCQTAEFGWSVGDVFVPYGGITGGVNAGAIYIGGYAMAKDATNVSLIIGGNLSGIHKSTGSSTSVFFTPANWKAVLRAWL